MTRCALVGCENEAETISRPMMSSRIYCREHFFEIYYGEDVIETARSMTDDSIKAEIRKIVTAAVGDRGR